MFIVYRSLRNFGTLILSKVKNENIDDLDNKIKSQNLASLSKASIDYKEVVNVIYSQLHMQGLSQVVEFALQINKPTKFIKSLVNMCLMIKDRVEFIVSFLKVKIF